MSDPNLSEVWTGIDDLMTVFGHLVQHAKGLHAEGEDCPTCKQASELLEDYRPVSAEREKEGHGR